MAFVQFGRERTISIGTGQGLFGLIETMDNNPIVCADAVCVPDAVSTLALIALEPLLHANLVCGPIEISTAGRLDEGELRRALALAGVGTQVRIREAVFRADSRVLVLSAATSLGADVVREDIEALYDEIYGRSFFVRFAAAREWDPNRALGSPNAICRLQFGLRGAGADLTIDVAADHAGKCGAAQIVHVLNVMAGFEETLGLAAP